MNKRTFECPCGKVYKTLKGFKKHQETCEYKNLNEEKIIWLGEIINEITPLFSVPYSKIKSFAKKNNLDMETAKKELIYQEFWKYRKSLWDVLKVMESELLVSEYRPFIKWVFDTYNDVTLVKLKGVLGNKKVIYRFNLNYTHKVIEKRISESIDFLEENYQELNDYQMIDIILKGDVSIYYVIFNDYLAEKWFSRLDTELQQALEYHVNIASKTIIDRIKPNDYDELNKLANSYTPNIYAI